MMYALHPLILVSMVAHQHISGTIWGRMSSAKFSVNCFAFIAYWKVCDPLRFLSSPLCGWQQSRWWVLHGTLMINGDLSVWCIHHYIIAISEYIIPGETGQQDIVDLWQFPNHPIPESLREPIWLTIWACSPVFSDACLLQYSKITHKWGKKNVIMTMPHCCVTELTAAAVLHR